MRIKNWDKFQHFKNRKPPWIKLYRDILDDVDINMISDRCHRVLIGLWLLASEDKEGNGKLPDVRTIAFRLRMTESEIVKCLSGLTKFVDQYDINLISDGYQVDAPEREREGEREAYKQEGEGERKKTRAPKTSKPTKLPDNFELGPELITWGVDNGFSSNTLAAEFDKFKDYAKANDKKYKDWAAAYRNWVRNSARFNNREGYENGNDRTTSNLKRNLERLKRYAEKGSNQQGPCDNTGRIATTRTA